MDNETINKRVHTEIMGMCWHEWRVQSSQFSKCQNRDCNVMQAECPRNPDYCTSLDLAATVEAVVIGKGVDVGYLTDCLANQVSSSRWIPFADAKARMVACLAAWGRGGD